jgi:hypothetical protein
MKQRSFPAYGTSITMAGGRWAFRLHGPPSFLSLIVLGFWWWFHGSPLLLTTIDAFRIHHCAAGMRRISTRSSKTTNTNPPFRLPLMVQRESQPHDDNPTSLLLDDFLAVAVDAARKAGAIISSHHQGVAVVDHKANSRDLLTVVDPLCEKVSPPMYVSIRLLYSTRAANPHHVFF